MDLALWRAPQHTQDQHILISPIKWGQALTHNTDTNVTRRGTTRLRGALAEKDHRADPNHTEQWEQATAPNRDTALRATRDRNTDDNPPPPATDGDQPPPEVWCTVLERGHYYVVSAAASPGPQWVIRETNTMLVPGTTPPRAVEEPSTPHSVLSGILQPGGQAPACAMTKITSGRAGYHLGLAMLCLTPWINRRWPTAGAEP